MFDLKGEMAKKMIEDLNGKFMEFGITFENCNVTQVHVSQILQQSLEEKSKVKF